MACPNCGSWAVRADRSLAGRLVCGRCGEPLGIRAARASRRHGRSGLSLIDQRRVFWWLLLAALVTLSAVLAALPERRPNQPSRTTSGLSSAPEPGAAAPAAAAARPSGRRG